VKLEKANETVWSIKRKEKPGKFECRFTEMDGMITRVTLALEKRDERIEFEMSPNEFESFFEILTNFKETISTPSNENINKVSNQDHYISSESSIAQPKPWTPGMTQSDQDEIDRLVKDFAETIPSEPVAEAVSSKNVAILASKKPISIGSKISSTDETATTPSSSKSSATRKQRLRETDWDPW